MSNPPAEQTVAVWTRLARAYERALGHVESRLKEAGLPPLAWYDALLEIERAGPAGIRPFALKDRLLLPQYGLSRLLARLERAGHVEQRPCPDDARGQIVVLTRAGADLRRRMWPVYAEALEEAVGRRLAQGDAAALVGLLERLSPR